MSKGHLPFRFTFCISKGFLAKQQVAFQSITTLSGRQGCPSSLREEHNGFRVPASESERPGLESAPILHISQLGKNYTNFPNLGYSIY